MPAEVSQITILSEYNVVVQLVSSNGHWQSWFHNRFICIDGGHQILLIPTMARCWWNAFVPFPYKLTCLSWFLAMHGHKERQSPKISLKTPVLTAGQDIIRKTISAGYLWPNLGQVNAQGNLWEKPYPVVKSKMKMKNSHSWQLYPVQSIQARVIKTRPKPRYPLPMFKMSVFLAKDTS